MALNKEWPDGFHSGKEKGKNNLCWSKLTLDMWRYALEKDIQTVLWIEIGIFHFPGKSSSSCARSYLQAILRDFVSNAKVILTDVKALTTAYVLVEESIIYTGWMREWAKMFFSYMKSQVWEG